LTITDSDNSFDYQKIVLSDVIISSLSTGGSVGQSLLTENISLNFAKVDGSYYKKNSDGSVVVDTRFGWDIRAKVGN
jgi:type VI secretion system secreted protein Hcp